MKTIYRILLLAFVVSPLFSCSQHDSFITSGNEQSRDDDGLVAYYPFNGDADDESGNGYDGVEHGVIPVEDRLCNENSAFKFSGEEGYIDVPGTESLYLNKFSISLWVMQDSVLENASNMIIEKCQWELPEEGGFYITYSSVMGLYLAINDDEYRHYTYYKPDMGDYTHVVATYDRFTGITNMYINYDEHVSTQTTAPVMRPSNKIITIGRVPFDYYGTWGDIDDIRIFNYVLSEQEIEELYHEGGWPDVIFGDEIEGSLNINPSNSTENRFEMVTPTGLIDIDILEGEGSHFTYDGLAFEISIKVKGQGKTLIINGTEYELSTDYRYTFIGEFEVYLYNARPGNKWNQAKGHWWIYIEGIAESIYPEIE